MPRPWLVLALALVVVSGAGTVADAEARNGQAAKKRKGKVVRVERSRLGGNRTPRLCTLQGQQAMCFVVPPKVGEVGQVLDDTGWKASVRVTQVDAQQSSCGTPSTYSVFLEVRQGDISQLNYNMQAMVIFDFPTSQRAKASGSSYGYVYGQSPVPIPGQRLGEMLLGAVDDESDGTYDYIVSWYYCDSSKAAQQSYGQGGNYCFVNYLRDTSGSYVERRIDVGCY